jgi:hypothetical protein
LRVARIDWWTAVTSAELDPAIVLGKLPREQWRTWPKAEPDAIDSYLDAVWRSLLAEYPSQVGSFLDPTTFLDAASVHRQVSAFVASARR